MNTAAFLAFLSSTSLTLATGEVYRSASTRKFTAFPDAESLASPIASPAGRSRTATVPPLNTSAMPSSGMQNPAVQVGVQHQVVALHGESAALLEG